MVRLARGRKNKKGDSGSTYADFAMMDCYCVLSGEVRFLLFSL